MASMKTEGVIKDEKAVLNTTIAKDILDAFKATCKRTGIPMNTLLEVFMKQYSEGYFTLKFAKNDSLYVDCD